MTELLMYSNRKCEPLFWDITLKSQHDLAFLELFKLLDEVWRCYNFEPEDAPELDQRALTGFNEQRALYLAAKGGAVDAAKRLLDLRRNYEYEEWDTYSTEN